MRNLKYSSSHNLNSNSNAPRSRTRCTTGWNTTSNIEIETRIVNRKKRFGGTSRGTLGRTPFLMDFSSIWTNGGQKSL